MSGGGLVETTALLQLFKADRRRLSLVDCTSFAVMDAEGMKEVLALDEDFEKQGYRVIPRSK